MTFQGKTPGFPLVIISQTWNYCISQLYHIINPPVVSGNRPRLLSSLPMDSVPGSFSGGATSRLSDWPTAGLPCGQQIESLPRTKERVRG